MGNYMIRLLHDGQIYTLMSALATLLFTGGCAETLCCIRFLQAVRRRRLGTVFRVLIEFLGQFPYGRLKVLNRFLKVLVCLGQLVDHELHTVNSSKEGLDHGL